MRASRKRVLVTGGSKGIGLATIERFRKEKLFDLIVVDKERSADLGKQVEFIQFDLTQIKEIPKLAKKVGDVDVLINNAGVLFALPFDNYPEEKMQEMLALNIQAPVALVREFSAGMVRKGSGRVVSMASVAGETGHPDVWYGVTKAGVINMTKSFARLLGNKGLIINAVAPGPVETDMLYKIPPERREMIRRNTYLGRFAKPEEVAETIYWLATESPEYINGFCIDINNGAFPR